MNFRRKMRKRRQSTANIKPTEKMTKRAMGYQCRDCGKVWRMWLELGLCEGGENHKPVPFAIHCKYCDGIAYHTDFGIDVKLGEPIPILKEFDYFANVKGRDCGIPQYANKK